MHRLAHRSEKHEKIAICKGLMKRLIGTISGILGAIGLLTVSILNFSNTGDIKDTGVWLFISILCFYITAKPAIKTSDKS